MPSNKPRNTANSAPLTETTDSRLRRRPIQNYSKSNRSPSFSGFIIDEPAQSTDLAQTVGSIPKRAIRTYSKSKRLPISPDFSIDEPAPKKAKTDASARFRESLAHAEAPEPAEHYEK